MKKLILVVTLVVLVAAAVFGGQAIASNKPADVTISDEASQEILFDWGSSYRGYPVRMKTLSGFVESSIISGPFWETLLDETYSGVRHVSLSIHVSGLDNPSDAIIISTDFPGLTFMGIEWIDKVGYKTYEFDVDNWRLSTTDYGNVSIEVFYRATITYPSNQW